MSTEISPPPICHRCDQPIGEGQPTTLEMGTSGFVVHASCPIPLAEQRAAETMLRVSLQDLKDLGLSVATRTWCYEQEWFYPGPAHREEMQRLSRLFGRIARMRSELEAQQARRTRECKPGVEHGQAPL